MSVNAVSLLPNVIKGKSINALFNNLTKWQQCNKYIEMYAEKFISYLVYHNITNCIKNIVLGIVLVRVLSSKSTYCFK